MWRHMQKGKQCGSSRRLCRRCRSPNGSAPCTPQDGGRRSSGICYPSEEATVSSDAMHFGFIQSSGQELVKQILVHCNMQGTGNCTDKFCYFYTTVRIKSGMVDVVCLICVAGCSIRPDVLQDNAWTIPSARDLSGH